MNNINMGEYNFKDLLLVEDPHTNIYGAIWMKEILKKSNPEFYLIETDIDFSDVNPNTKFIGISGRVEVDLEYALKNGIHIIAADPYQGQIITHALSFLTEDIQSLDLFDAVKRLYISRYLNDGFENVDDFYSSLRFAQIVDSMGVKRESGMVNKILEYIDLRTKDSPIVARFGRSHIDRLEGMLNDYDINIGRIKFPENNLKLA
jgi:hypothetical protein